MKRKINFRLAATFIKLSSIAAAMRCLVVCREPLSLLYHYITRNPLLRESFPYHFRTPTGDLRLRAYCVEDVITLFIIFCRREYTPREGARVFVDFGSNIGVAAAYFLSRDRQNIVYCYEPNEVNTERLRENLRQFEKRYFLEEICVGLENGVVRFGVEATGVYGAIGVEHEGGSTFEVKCRRAGEILSEITDEHPEIDFLKIDIEGLEQEVIKAIEPEMLTKIGQIQAETGEFNHDLPGFRRSGSGAIVKFERLRRYGQAGPETGKG
jgi:FkbM family methyltransferase